jgi:TRAP transporter TAXI family solute receptor
MLLLADGDIDLGIVTLGTIALAYEGIGYDRPYTEFLSLGYLWSHPQVWIALASSPYNSVADLQNARVAIGPGPGAWNHLAQPLLEAHGIDFDKLDKVYAGFADMYASVGDGRVDASVSLLTGGAALLPAAEELAFQRPVKYLTMDPAAIARAVEATPWYFPIEIDSSLLPGFVGDTYHTFDQGGVFMLVRDEMSDQDAYALTAAMHRALMAVADEVPFVREAALNPKMILAEFAGSPMHPGAARYWADAGITP